VSVKWVEPSYKTLRPTIAILTPGGKRVPITIPQGAVITVLRAPLDDSYLVEAKWENKAVKMFVTDLRDRSITVPQQRWRSFFKERCRCPAVRY